MIGSGLKKLAAANGLQIDGGVAYGVLKGCFVSLSEGSGYKRMCIYAGCYHKPEGVAAAVEGEVPEHLQVASAIADYIVEYAGDFKTYRIMNSKHKLPGVSIVQGGSVVQINFFDNPGTIKCIEAFIENILPEIAPTTQPHVCMKCGLGNNDTTKPVLLPDEAVVPMHEGCANEIIAALGGKKARAGGTLGGILGALIGSAIGAVVWAAIGVMGYIASIVGLLIAFLASKGYDLLGGKPGKVKLVTLIICVLLAVVVGTVGTQVYFIHEVYVEGVAELKSWEVAKPEMEFIMEVIPVMWEDSEVAGAVAGDIGMGWLFAALGCFGILRSSTGGKKVRILKG